MSNDETLQRLEQKVNTIEELLLSQKIVLTFDEAAIYAGLSRSYLYKLTSTGKIPFYKPNGKLIYFEKSQLEKWLMRNQEVHEEIESKAATYVTLNKRGGRS